jgi:hypothetical protein
MNNNGSGQTAVTATGGWTQRTAFLSGSPHSTFFDNALPAPGSNTISGTTSSADLWNISLVTLEVGAAPAAPLQPFTRVQFFVNDTVIQS